MARIVNIDALTFQPRQSYTPPAETRQRYAVRMAEVAVEVGACRLGYNVTEVPPHFAAFPLHNHRVNEEMFFILEGRGELRIGDERSPLRQGDFVACPPGDQTTAHQIVNTGDAPLRYLAVSTMIFPDISEYPDSQKFLIAEQPRNPDGTSQGFRHVGRHRDTADYWEGE